MDYYSSKIDYHFSEWLLGLIEDDPVPGEIKYLTFIITEYRDRYELALTGSENKPLLCEPGFYYPLECQCFFLTDYFNLRPLGRPKVFNFTKNMIIGFFEKQRKYFESIGGRTNGRSSLAGKTISLGFRGKKATFLVKC